MKTLPDIQIIRQWTTKYLINKIPLAESFLLEQGIEIDIDDNKTIDELFSAWSEIRKEPVNSILQKLIHRVQELDSLLSNNSTFNFLDIKGGIDKSGNSENVKNLILHRGDLLAIVGPTGSGKSRLLADIEWVAKGDTPSKRTILINGKESDDDKSFSDNNYLIAQLSQTMSFVLDSTVYELLELHAESRCMNASVIDQTLEAANELSGEPFYGSTPLTSLSGGQTRALMVADTALVCKSPIVLIDEIENAGIDRRKAFDLLLSNEKIVLIATHDPLLALLAPKRLCMRNGSMSLLKERTENEISILGDLEKMDEKFSKIRSQLRIGDELSL